MDLPADSGTDNGTLSSALPKRSSRGKLCDVILRNNDWKLPEDLWQKA